MATMVSATRTRACPRSRCRSRGSAVEMRLRAITTPRGPRTARPGGSRPRLPGPVRQHRVGEEAPAEVEDHQQHQEDGWRHKRKLDQSLAALATTAPAHQAAFMMARAWIGITPP